MAAAIVLLLLGTAAWGRHAPITTPKPSGETRMGEESKCLAGRKQLGSLLRQAGKFRRSIGHFEQALRIKPDFGEAHYNWGVTLAD